MTGIETMQAIEVCVRGVVQGVGFRPFVYRLAHDLGLAGWVRNTSGCVEIEAEGPRESLEMFLAGLRDEAPPMAHIDEIKMSAIEAKGLAGFEIRESQSEEGEYQLVSPDIATCSACLEEIFDPQDRRYRYPFTNCTNCGPRFTIIEDIPYDRPRTTMRWFTMCPDCQREYEDPLNRRFHAQPNACPVCGPTLELVDNEGTRIESEDVIQAAAVLLREGGILAIKGLGGFLLACDAGNAQAVRLLRERKERPSKPLAVMMATLDEVRKHCRVSPVEENLLLSPQSPIVLLEWRTDSLICQEVAPGLRHLGVVLPYTPLHHLLLRDSGLPLVMTSGNLSEEPIAKDNDEAQRRLGLIADYFLWHNRDIYAKYDDSVCAVEGNTAQSLRRARGYAPYPVPLPFECRQVLACGAEEKNTFCLTRGHHAFVSQHIGDMENEETLEHFEATIDLYERLFRVKPEVIAYDLHPEYLSTKYALGLKDSKSDGLRFVPVQHHHAHVVSCLVENNLPGPVIGVAFDGTGYGSDGTLWGGEFLVADWRRFDRVGHLEAVPMPGGAAAIRKPYRMALGYLYSLIGTHISLEGLPVLDRIDDEELAIIGHQVERDLNAPLTSGAGRLFDAVSAIAGVRGVVDYDAQAAIELEMEAMQAAAGSGEDLYPFRIAEEGGSRVVKLADLIAAVVTDARLGQPSPVVAARFHRTVADIIVQMCRLISGDTGLRVIALSGGVFQNRLLTRMTVPELRRQGFEVLVQRLAPCNDGGISLGQAVVGHFAAG
jgi:hydrogenase maturation protein HypF